jgi:putative FmdB family regulatory protein
MPVYEYHCRACGETFDRVEPLSEHGRGRLSCPHCKSSQVHQVLTTFFAKTGRKS